MPISTTITATAIASALLIASPFTAEAAEASDTISFCTEVNSLAETVMTNRQHGVGMAEMIGAVSEYDLGQEIIRDAFETPRFSSPEYRQRAITEFSSGWFAACLDAAES